MKRGIIEPRTDLAQLQPTLMAMGDEGSSKSRIRAFYQGNK